MFQLYIPLLLISLLSYAQIDFPTIELPIDVDVIPLTPQVSIQICKNPKLQEPCIYFSQDLNLEEKRWSDGTSMTRIGSIKISNNLYRVHLQSNGLGTVQHPSSIHVKKEDGIVDLSKYDHFNTATVERAHGEICSGLNFQGNCLYLWEDDNILHDSYGIVGFSNNIKSLRFNPDYEIVLCSEDNYQGSCFNFEKDNSIPDLIELGVTEVDSIQLLKIQSAPLKVCKQKYLKGYCQYLTKADLDLSDNQGIIGFDKAIRSIKIGAHYVATICTQKNLQGICSNYGGYNNDYVMNLTTYNDTRTSSIDFSRNTGIWGEYVYERNYPHNASNDWADNVNGVAHDDNNWYIAQESRLVKYPFTKNLMSSPSRQFNINVCNHYGDPTFHNGEIYVPVEGCPEGRRIEVFNPNLQKIRYGILPQGHASWVSINPVNGLMYSSDFYKSKYGKEVHVYDPNFKNGEKIKYLYTIRLDTGIKRIQGGAFSPNGNLYLVSDNRHSTPLAGIYQFTIRGREGINMKFISPNGFAPGLPHCEEMQGITIVNMNSKNAPKIKGQIHWILIQNDLGNADDLYFKHISVDDPDKL